MKRYLVQTFGCQMNVHDSLRMEEILAASGYEPTDEITLADAIVINTCSVREKAEHKLMSLLGTLRPLKEQRPSLAIAVAGCVAQQEGEALLQKAPFIDLVIGPDNIPELPRLLQDVAAGAPPRARTIFDNDDPQFLVAQPNAASLEVTAFVTTMKGCDERCTFCIVPYTRGSERYRHADDIVREIADLAAAGVREVTLLGQTVNSWYEPDVTPSGRTAPSGSQFAGLLERIAREVPSLARLRYTSPHPRHLTDALIDAHASLAVLPSHVHLPVQSGSNAVLKRMSRRYTREHYIERVRALVAKKPGLTLSTDVIVGFPGETDVDFEETISLVREVGFVSLFGFKYSPRPKTPAQKLEDDVPEHVKDERLARLFEVVAQQQTAHLDALVGTTQSVLVEGPSRGDAKNRFMGRSARHEIVHLDVPLGTDPTGHLVDVVIERAFKHSLAGTMLTLPTEAMRVKRVPSRRLRVIDAAVSG